MSDQFEPLPAKKYGVIYADPPWDYDGQMQYAGRPTSSAAMHYRTMKTSDLKDLDVQAIAEKDCMLFMWATSPHLDQAIELGKAWGFRWCTVAFVWDKIRTNPGFYTMSRCELCLAFKNAKGKIPQPRGARNIQQFVSQKRSAHSKKPDEVRRRIELMFPKQKKIELFARENPTGWDTWGDQA